MSILTARCLIVVVGSALLAGALLTACADDSEAAQIAAAKSHLASKDSNAGIIHLKSAIQKFPDSGELRYLFGVSLLKAGDAKAAALELEKALQAKYSLNEVAPVLADAYLKSGQHKRLSTDLAAISLSDTQAASKLKTALAAASIFQGDTNDASSKIQDALRLNPTNTSAKLLQARMVAGDGSFDQAIQIADQIISLDKANIGAWNIKGELLWLGKGQADQAAESFRQVLKIDPADVSAHGNLIRLLLQRDDAAAAHSQLAEMVKHVPNHPETKLFVAQVALQKGDLATAKLEALKLLLVFPENPYILETAGSAELKLGSLVSAEIHLTKALSLLPSLSLSRKLLGEIHLKRAQPAKAYTVLKPLLAAGSRDAEASSLAGESLMQMGEFAKAEQLFRQAIEVDPNGSKQQVALAMVQISKGLTDKGLSQLKALAATAKDTYADLALVATQLRIGDAVAALETLEKLQLKDPKAAFPLMLRGRIQAARGDKAAARGSFESAQSVDGSYLPAVMGLVELDMLDKNPTSAVKRLEAFLSNDPKNFRAILGLVEARRSMGAKPDELMVVLNDAIKANPNEPLLRVALIDTLLSRHQVKEALIIAQQAEVALPNSLDARLALGRVQYSAGDLQQAMTTFNKAASAFPASPDAYALIADIHLIKQDLSAASQYYRKALEVSPKSVKPYQGLTRIAMLSKKPAEALQIARTVQKELPGELVGYNMEVDVHVAQKAWDSAAEVLRRLLSQFPSTDAAKRLHSLYTVAGRAADAQKLEETWLKTAPKDSDFIYHLGSIALGRNDMGMAEQRFRQVLALEPENGGAANNVAWLMIKQGRPGALEYAQQARRLLPDNAAVLDTLAMAFAGDKQFASAVDTQRQAVAKGQGAAVAQYKLKLARYLIEAGNAEGARLELDSLRALGDRFPAQAEVKDLLAKLR